MEDKVRQYRKLVDASGPVHPRLLEDLDYRRVGSTEPRRFSLTVAGLAAVTVLVIAAAVAVLTNARLGQQIAGAPKPTASAVVAAPVVATSAPIATAPVDTVTTPEAPDQPEPSVIEECADSDPLFGPVSRLRVKGVTYQSAFPGWTRSATVPQGSFIGSQYAQIRRKVAPSGGRAASTLQDGESFDLPVGTPVYTFAGYSPQFRLVAELCGRLTVYDAAENPAAKTGADLLDIEGKVRWIEVEKRATESFGQPLAAKAIVNGDATVSPIVDAVVGAPVARWTMSDAYPIFVVHFALRDGTEATAVYRGGWISTSDSATTAIKAPRDFRTAIREAVGE